MGKIYRTKNSSTSSKTSRKRCQQKKYKSSILPLNKTKQNNVVYVNDECLNLVEVDQSSPIETIESNCITLNSFIPSIALSPINDESEEFTSLCFSSEEEDDDLFSENELKG